jgi:Ca-activated chloride channel family protein
MAFISFLYPKFLTLLLLVPFFVFVYFFSIVYNKKKAVLFANFEAMERFYDVEFFSKNFFALYINLAVLILLIFSAAGTAITFNVDTSAYSYVIAIDNSGSMAADDIAPTRFAAAKTEAINFIEKLPVGVEVGVIGFSGDALVMQTLDNSKLKSKMAIESLEFGKIQGTNIYNALIASNKLFEERQMKSVILISDGQLNIGDAPQITRYANRNNLVVNTIAVGTEEGGKTDFDTVSKVDEDFLKALAFNTGGQFFRVKDVTTLGESFDELIKRTNKAVTVDISFYLLLAAIVVFTLMWVLHSLRFKVVPI